MLTGDLSQRYLPSVTSRLLNRCLRNLYTLPYLSLSRPIIPIVNSPLNKPAIFTQIPCRHYSRRRPSSRLYVTRTCGYARMWRSMILGKTAAGLTCGETAAGFHWRVTRACPTKMPEDDRSTMQDFKQLPALPGHRLLCQCGTYQ